MNPKLKSVLQYLITIAITGVLVWLSLRGINAGEGHDTADLIWSTWTKSNKIYLILMAGVLLLSHVLRAERWRMLLEPSGNKGTLGNSFLSVMVGYLVNLAIPRGGEVSRCYNLFKLEKTPVEVSFGTVVVERLVDVICMLILVFISFVAEWEKLKMFMDSLNIGGSGGGTKLKFSPLMLIVIFGVIGVVALIYFLRNNPRFKKLLAGFKDGFLAIFKLKNKWLFIGYSIAIWGLYFLMSYTVMFAFDETAHLGMRAVLTIFAIGAIAMAAPLPGGAGSYHLLLPMGLVSLYAMNRADAVAFVFIFHAWQTLVLAFFGVMCLLISLWIIRWKNQQIKSV